MQAISFSSVAIVALGGSLGASSRYLMGVLLQQYVPGYPWATLVVNSMGCFCAGLLLGMALFRLPPHPTFMLFGMTGFLGSFTTFSAFGYEVHQLWWQNRPTEALLHIFANMMGSLLSVGLGLLCFWLWINRIGSPTP